MTNPNSPRDSAPMVALGRPLLHTLRATVRGKGAVDDPGVIFGVGDAEILRVSPLLDSARWQAASALLGRPGNRGRVTGRQGNCLRNWLGAKTTTSSRRMVQRRPGGDHMEGRVTLCVGRVIGRPLLAYSHRYNST
jgi:hypothetical protein